MQKITENNHQNHFFLPSQHHLLGMMSEFIMQQDGALKNETITVKDIHNGSSNS